MGKGLKFLEGLLFTKESECIVWPFYIMKNGYGQVGLKNGMKLSHRVMCELIHENKENKPQVAHLCGNRSCVNPNHLKWSTQKENEDDKIKHGTWQTRISTSKLNEERVLEIRKEFVGGKTYKELSIMFLTPISTIKKVIKRYTWKHV